MGYIYRITNNIDGKCYIGQTLYDDVNKRWNQHKNINHKSYCLYLYNAIKKYQPVNFKFEIICICFDEEYIKNFNTLAPNGYNLRLGGKNGRQHPDSNEKRRISATGKKYGPPSDQLKKC